MECRYAMPAAISLAKETLCSQGKGWLESCSNSVNVPPEIYSVTKCKRLSLYNTPMKRSTLLWLRLLSTAT